MISWLCQLVIDFLHETRNVGFDVGGDGDDSVLAHQKLSIEIPGWISGTRFGLEKLPHLRGVAAQDVSQLHEYAGKFLLGSKLCNGCVVPVFLPSKLLAGKGQNDELVPVFLPERLELCVFAPGCASSGGNVGGIDDLAAAVFHVQSGAVAFGGGE